MRVASAMCSTSVTLLALLFFNKVLPNEFEASARLSPKYSTSDARRESIAYQKLASWPMAKEIDNQTLAVTTLFASPFASCQTHRVRLPSGAIVSDWLYFEERPHINLLVRTKDDNKFVVFKQSKYATGPTLAPVGGYVEDGESPVAAARRELMEELGLRTPKLRALGSFMTSANRGSGRVYAFFADACQPAVKHDLNRPKQGRADLEAQRVERLTREQLLDALVASQFVEVKWTATISLALLTIPE